MSIRDNTPLPGDASLDHAMLLPAARPAGPLTQGDWPATAFGGPEGKKGPNLMTFLHALRRRWIAVVAAGSLCAILAAAVTWVMREKQYEAQFMLQLLPATPTIVFTNPEQQSQYSTANAFDIFRETQMSLVKSRFVLITALRNEGIKACPSIMREERKQNAVNWLMENVRTSFAMKNAGIMVISVTTSNPSESATIVNGVVNAYFEEVVNSERRKRQFRLDKLDKIYIDKENAVRDRRAMLKDTAKQYGTSDSEALSLRQQLEVQRYADYEKELVRLKFERDRARGDLKAHEEQIKGLAALEISDYEVIPLTLSDPLHRQLVEQLAYVKQIHGLNSGNVVKGAGSQYLDKNSRELAVTQAMYEEYLRDMREKVRGMKHVELEKERRKLHSEVSILDEQFTTFQKDVDAQKARADAVGEKSIEVEMMRQEVKNLDAVLSSIAEERERLRVELDSGSRVERVGEKAEVPETEKGWFYRIALILFAAMLGFAAPVFAIALWDVQAGRINVASEVTQALGLRVIGSLPMIPARVIRQLGSSSRRNQAWRVRLTESVDALTARLLRKAEVEQSRVLLVSSAVGGEGKTTLATQLAMSLARNRRRTVLVDFDLRRPALDGVFGLPLEPGVCDILRGQGDVLRMVHPTATEHLSLLPAGRWDRQILAALANGGAGMVLDQLRANYDFVIVDSSPILPVADTRFVSQKVDCAILSVFRDVTQGPQLLSVCEILEAFGVRTIEAVVTGGQDPSYGRVMGYEPAVAETYETADVHETGERRGDENDQN